MLPFLLYYKGIKKDKKTILEGYVLLDNIKAAIFDLDGTLIDSMGVWEKIDTNFLKIRGIKAPSDLIDNIVHLNFADSAKYFKKAFNLSESIEDIMNEWNTMAYDEYASNIKLKKGAKEYLAFLKSKGIKIGLATSNNPTLLEVVLKNNGIYDYFDAITTTSEVERGKDFPDVYFLSAKKLGALPKDCVVFEDIFVAVLSAKSAGMKVVAVHDNNSEHQIKDIAKNADRFIYKYDELLRAV